MLYDDQLNRITWPIQFWGLLVSNHKEVIIARQRLMWGLPASYNLALLPQAMAAMRSDMRCVTHRCCSHLVYK